MWIVFLLKGQKAAFPCKVNVLMISCVRCAVTSYFVPYFTTALLYSKLVLISMVFLIRRPEDKADRQVYDNFKSRGPCRPCHSVSNCISQVLMYSPDVARGKLKIMIRIEFRCEVVLEGKLENHFDMDYMCSDFKISKGSMAWMQLVKASSGLAKRHENNFPGDKLRSYCKSRFNIAGKAPELTDVTSGSFNVLHS